MAETITKEEVERFLKLFYQKAKVFGILFRNDRDKNRKALLELDITPKTRESIVMQLKADDYVEGPILDTLNKQTDLWVFGKDVKGREVYIKITMGVSGSSTVCISFHLAEKKLRYLFK